MEGLPLGGSGGPAERRLAIDGLRLRLDLRIVPSEAGSGDATAAAIWRIEQARLGALPLGMGVPYRWVAVAAALGAMLLALGVWFAGSPSATPGVEPSAGPTPLGAATAGTPEAARAHRERAPSAPATVPVPAPTAPGSAGAAAAGASPVASSPVPRVAAGGGSTSGLPSGAARRGLEGASADHPSAPPAPASAPALGVAPRIAVVRDPVGSTPSAGSTPAAAPAQLPPAVGSRAEDTTGRRGLARTGSAGTTGTAAPAPSTAARREVEPAMPATPPASESSRGDMLDLFGDPK